MSILTPGGLLLCCHYLDILWIGEQYILGVWLCCCTLHLNVWTSQPQKCCCVAVATHSIWTPGGLLLCCHYMEYWIGEQHIVGAWLCCCTLLLNVWTSQPSKVLLCCCCYTQHLNTRRIAVVLEYLKYCIGEQHIVGAWLCCCTLHLNVWTSQPQKCCCIAVATHSIWIPGGLLLCCHYLEYIGLVNCFNFESAAVLLLLHTALFIYLNWWPAEIILCRKYYF